MWLYPIIGASLATLKDGCSTFPKQPEIDHEKSSSLIARVRFWNCVCNLNYELIIERSKWILSNHHYLTTLNEMATLTKFDRAAKVKDRIEGVAIVMIKKSFNSGKDAELPFKREIVNSPTPRTNIGVAIEQVTTAFLKVYIKKDQLSLV